MIFRNFSKLTVVTCIGLCLVLVIVLHAPYSLKNREQLYGSEQLATSLPPQRLLQQGYRWKLQQIINDEKQNQMFYEKELEMKNRSRTVASVCRREGLGIYALPSFKRRINFPPVPHLESFFFDRVHRIAWCPIFKAASTSWLNNFCLLGGLSSTVASQIKENWMKIAREFWPSLSFQNAYQEFLDSEVSFFIVRHPFERLVSAFRDKLENKSMGQLDGTEFYYEKFGKGIVSRYRKKQKHNKETGRLKGEIDYEPHSSQLEPTFEEFVRYLIDLDLIRRADDHWIPYYLSCTPCWLNFDVIAKFETLEDDQKYIIYKANITHLLSPSWKHGSNVQVTSKKAEEYFSTISLVQLLQLYHKYKIDFDMFEYTIDEYLKFVQ